MQSLLLKSVRVFLYGCERQSNVQGQRWCMGECVRERERLGQCTSARVAVHVVKS